MRRNLSRPSRVAPEHPPAARPARAEPARQQAARRRPARRRPAWGRPAWSALQSAGPHHSACKIVRCAAAGTRKPNSGGAAPVLPRARWAARQRWPHRPPTVQMLRRRRLGAASVPRVRQAAAPWGQSHVRCCPPRRLRQPWPDAGVWASRPRTKPEVSVLGRPNRRLWTLPGQTRLAPLCAICVVWRDWRSCAAWKASNGNREPSTVVRPCRECK